MSSVVGGLTSVADALDHAAGQVDRSLVADSNYMDLAEILQVPKHSK